MCTYYILTYVPSDGLQMNQNRLGAFVIQQCHGPLAARRDRQQRTYARVSKLASSIAFLLPMKNNLPYCLH